jgi:hypothetical protein
MTSNLILCFIIPSFFAKTETRERERERERESVREGGLSHEFGGKYA